MINRIASVAVAASAAVGLMFNGALPAFAAVNPSNFIGGPQASGSGCHVGLMLSRLSANTPADVAAEVGSTSPGHTCTGWVERSHSAGKTVWAVASAKVALRSASGLAGIANTGLVYDRPGYKARGCAQSSARAPSAWRRARGTATSPALAASYLRLSTVAVIFRGSSTKLGECFGLLASSGATKKAGTSVVALLDSEADPCTAWIQTTANKGKTWTTVSPVVSYRSPNVNTDVLAFTAHYADGPGHLARLCVKDMTSKKQSCSGGW